GPKWLPTRYKALSDGKPYYYLLPLFLFLAAISEAARCVNTFLLEANDVWGEDVLLVCIGWMVLPRKLPPVADNYMQSSAFLLLTVTLVTRKRIRDGLMALVVFGFEVNLQAYRFCISL